MLTRSGSVVSRGSRLAIFFSVAACSPDTSLLNGQATFAGSDTGGDGTSAIEGGRTNSGGATNAGGNPPAVAESGAANGGDGADDPPAGGGEAGASGCVAKGEETCNLRDDDCNGVVDDGCPSGATTTFEKDLAVLGDSASGAAFTEDCKDGEAIAGVTVTMGAFLSQARGVCRAISLELSASAPHGYRVALRADRALPAHPTASTDASTSLSCPENEAVVGLRLAQQHYTLLDESSIAVTSRVWLSCAKLVLVERDGKLEVGWEGKKELAPASGNIANDTAWLVSSSAPEGLVASRLLGNAGDWVDRLGFGVSRVDIVLN